MTGNVDGVVHAFLTAFGPRLARIYTHDDLRVAEPFLARGLDIELRLTDAHAAMRAIRRYPGRAAVWDLERDSDVQNRVAVLYNPFGRDADATADLIAWLCGRCPDDVLLILSSNRSCHLTDLEASMAEAGYEFHPRSARLASAMVGAFPIVRAYRHLAKAGDCVRPSALALCTEGAEAALKRADLAAQFIRPGDLVLDDGDWGGGSAVVLHIGSAARRTIGLVPMTRARDALNVRYGRPGSLEFMTTQEYAPDLERPDFIFHTSNHVVECADHLPLIAAAAHERLAMLTPAGRLFLAIAFARSPERADLVRVLIKDMTRHAIVERLFCQSSATVPDGPDVFFEVAADSKCEGDWLIVVAMTSPLADNAPPYVEQAFAVPAEAKFEVARFDAVYLRPWIIKGLVARGMRPDNPEVLRRLAIDVQQMSPLSSVDYAAALCVEAYQIDVGDTDSVDEVRRRISNWLDTPCDPNPHWLRWQVSLLAVLSRLHLSRGDVDAALAACERCASLDVIPFSPLLGSKTLEAMHLAAIIRLARGEHESSRAHLRDAVREAKRLLSGDWLNILGDLEKPLIFGIPEASQLLAIATRSAALLARFEEIKYRGGAVWALMSDLSGQRFTPMTPSESSLAERPDGTAPDALDATTQIRLADAAQRLADLSAELADARGQATTAYAMAAAAKDQAANAFAQLAEVRREAAVTVEAAHRQMDDARGQATTAYAMAAAAKDQATTAYAMAAAAKDQAANAFAQLAEVRREAAVTVEAAHYQMDDARGQATTAYAMAAAAKDQAASAFAQLAEVRRDAAATVEAAVSAPETD